MRSSTEFVTNVALPRCGSLGRGWTICDLLAHLTEWEQMFLRWYRAGLKGDQPIMPAPSYKWNETPRLNQAIVRKHRRKPIGSVLNEFETSYQKIFLLTLGLSEDELLVPGHFAWTGKYPLTTYLAPNTCSHYRFASKVVKRWLKPVTLDKSSHPSSRRN